MHRDQTPVGKWKSNFVLFVLTVSLISSKRDWVRWWGDPRDPKEREHMEIKIMNDMATKARDGRCVEIRGSSLYDDILSKAMHPLY